MCTWRATFGLWLISAGCGSVSGSSPGEIDASPVVIDAGEGMIDTSPELIDASEGMIDAQVDAAVPNNILISGNALDVMNTTIKACANCLITLLASDSVSELNRVTTDSLGNFVMTQQTRGNPLDVSLAADRNPTDSYFRTNLYFPAPLTADHSVRLRVVDPTAIRNLEQLAGDPTVDSNLLIMNLRDASGRPLADATVTTDSPNMIVRYTDGSERPVPINIRATTAGDGVAYGFLPTTVPRPSMLTIAAAASGMTLSHTSIRMQRVTIVELAP